jgi:hypothetical protein
MRVPMGKLIRHPDILDRGIPDLWLCKVIRFDFPPGENAAGLYRYNLGYRPGMGGNISYR